MCLDDQSQNKYYIDSQDEFVQKTFVFTFELLKLNPICTL
jgi:hypothetical protein